MFDEIIREERTIYNKCLKQLKKALSEHECIVDFNSAAILTDSANVRKAHEIMTLMLEQMEQRNLNFKCSFSFADSIVKYTLKDDKLIVNSKKWVEFRYMDYDIEVSSTFDNTSVVEISDNWQNPDQFNFFGFWATEVIVKPFFNHFMPKFDSYNKVTLKLSVSIPEDAMRAYTLKFFDDVVVKHVDPDYEDKYKLTTRGYNDKRTYVMKDDVRVPISKKDRLVRFHEVESLKLEYVGDDERVKEENELTELVIPTTKLAKTFTSRKLKTLVIGETNDAEFVNKRLQKNFPNLKNLCIKKCNFRPIITKDFDKLTLGFDRIIFPTVTGKVNNLIINTPEFVVEYPALYMSRKVIPEKTFTYNGFTINVE